ncbi:MAG TPA: hypothetical protein VIJ48_05815 [Acidimicrobiia bacterium]
MARTLLVVFAGVERPGRASRCVVQGRRSIFVAVIASVTVAVSAPPAVSQGIDRAVVARGAAASFAAARFAANGGIVARDISFPQCVGSMPRVRGATLGVLGANNGTSYTRNPCLVTELAWAKRLPGAPAFYANTANPGPGHSAHWPLGQSAPRVCTASDPNSSGCSYDYGWNAALQSFAVAADAAQRLHHVDRANARYRAANVDWWLDVETMNSWQAVEGHATATAQRRDVATLVGEIDALRSAGVARVGAYSTAYQWNLITGGTNLTHRTFADIPQWLAGYESHTAATAGCGDRGFTSGPVVMTQYLGRDGFDADVLCTSSGGDGD